MNTKYEIINSDSIIIDTKDSIEEVVSFLKKCIGIYTIKEIISNDITEKIDGLVQNPETMMNKRNMFKRRTIDTKYMDSDITVPPRFQIYSIETEGQLAYSLRDYIGECFGTEFPLRDDAIAHGYTEKYLHSLELKV